LINEILKLYEEKDSNSSNIMKLQSILDRIYSFDRNIALIQKKTQQEQIVVDLLQLTKEEEAISIDILNIRTLVYKLKAIDATIVKTQEKLNTFEDMWHKEFPDKCPLCGK
jgi:hypothetical protein